MPKVPPVAAAWPSSEVVAQQSVSVMTLKPFSHAVRMVDSTQQLVRKPQSTSVSMPLALSSASSVVFGKASRPFLPTMTTSSASGAIASQNLAFHASAANEMGACMTVPPAARTAAAVADVFASMSVDSMTPLTAGYSLPPSVVNSFWYSMQSMATLDGTTSQPPLASAAEKVEKAAGAVVDSVTADLAFREKSGI